MKVLHYSLRQSHHLPNAHLRVSLNQLPQSHQIFIREMAAAATTTLAPVVTTTLAPVVTTTLSASIANMTDGERIVHDVEAALVRRLNEMIVEYHPWIVGLGVTALTFFMFVFIFLVFILILLMWRKKGMKATKGNYNRFENDEEQYRMDYRQTYT
ncbi:14 [Haliotid herpesvirus 1]|nr:14 [Haliotid herpesvirus 1]